ncbi:MAG: exodeoxyribonuclease VII large subunit [Pseudoflavonifractor sp.]|nr:exodeoxyribonuclease VII large subunit [Pseudoflavonifractor sp.]
MTTVESVTLLDLMRRITALVTVPSTQGVWVTAELSDVAVRGGHCYMELLQKDASSGQTVARARATMWANVYSRIAPEFLAVTGQRFATGIKVMLRVSANMHPVFGLSLNITAVNPDYTMGDLMRRRREILMRLQAEGILEANRSLEWPEVPSRVAVISAPGAAGYGDFLHQLYTNPSRLRFVTRLFPAVMQGRRTAPAVIAALDAIAADAGEWDCVVIIRGGGATSDLLAFDDYELASNIAQFPLPVIIGIGHERDVTVLDYVANMRVKTPTAAAEWLIARGNAALDRVARLAADIHRYVSDRVAGMRMQLAQYGVLLPTLPGAALERARLRLDSTLQVVGQLPVRHIAPRRMALDHLAATLATVTSDLVRRATVRLDGLDAVVVALSPAAVLRRGFTVTRCGGMTVRSLDDVSPGDVIETVTADGSIFSVVGDGTVIPDGDEAAG